MFQVGTQFGGLRLTAADQNQQGGEHAERARH